MMHQFKQLFRSFLAKIINTCRDNVKDLVVVMTNVYDVVKFSYIPNHLDSMSISKRRP